MFSSSWIEFITGVPDEGEFPSCSSSAIPSDCGRGSILSRMKRRRSRGWEQRLTAAGICLIAVYYWLVVITFQVSGSAIVLVSEHSYHSIRH